MYKHERFKKKKVHMQYNLCYMYGYVRSFFFWGRGGERCGGIFYSSGCMIWTSFCLMVGVVVVGGASCCMYIVCRCKNMGGAPRTDMYF